MSSIAKDEGRVSAGVRAAIAGIVVSIVALGSSFLSALNGRPPEFFLPIGVTGLVYAVAGALVYNRRPDNLIGPMLLAVAGLSSGLVALRYLFPITVPLNEAFSQAANLLPLAYVILSFPSGRLARGSFERRVMSLVLVLAALSGLAELLTLEPALHMDPARCAPCTVNPLRLLDADLHRYVEYVTAAALVAATGLGAVAAVRRWRFARGLTRRALTPVLAGGLVLAAVLLLFTILELVGFSVPFGSQILLFVRLLVPVGLAVVFLRLFSARSNVSHAVVELGRGTSVPRLETALRTALADPDVVVARWSPSSDAYFDSEGRTVDIEAARSRGGLMELERDGSPLAAVVHDPSLANDPKLLDAVGNAARFALDVSELRDELLARGGDADRLPRGDVAFLFGDVEGSTEILARLGDAYGAALADLRRLIRVTTGRYSGEVVDIRADDCFLVFGGSAKVGATSALASAIDLQRNIAANTWPQGVALPLRIGLHSGRPDLNAGGYVGLDVHRAARVMSAAHGGQIIASESFVRAVGSEKLDGIEFIPLGRFRLRGLPGRGELYQVAAPGLVREFSPPRGLVEEAPP